MGRSMGMQGTLEFEFIGDFVHEGFALARLNQALSRNYSVQMRLASRKVR
jgi:hypothetical protein